MHFHGFHLDVKLARQSISISKLAGLEASWYTHAFDLFARHWAMMAFPQLLLRLCIRCVSHCVRNLKLWGASFACEHAQTTQSLCIVLWTDFFRIDHSLRDKSVYAGRVSILRFDQRATARRLSNLQASATGRQSRRSSLLNEERRACCNWMGLAQDARLATKWEWSRASGAV